MCIYFYKVSSKKFVHHPALIANNFSHHTQKAYHTRQNPFPTQGRKPIFWAILNRPFFLFFCHRGFLRPRIGLCFEGKPQRESIFFPSLTHQRIVTFRIEIRFDFNDTHVNTHLNTTRKMFSLTQSASFCAGTKVNVAAQKKQQSKIKRSSIQAKAMISSESLSKRDFLSAAVLSFGFLSVGDANAATKRVRKSSSSAAPVKKSPAAKKSAAKPAYKPKGKTVVPAPSVATSPAARRGRRGVPIAGKSSSVSGGKRKTRSPAQARKGKY